MSSSCISSGGGRAYGFDLEIVKSASSTCSILSHSSSSSPSSTLSESSNSPIAISTRKPRTPRKRPNQTYNEAAALLSTACPNIFSTKHLPRKGIPKFTKQQPQPSHSYFFQDPSTELLLIENSGLEKPGFRIEPKQYNYSSPKVAGVHDFRGDLLLDDDFDTESMLDEEMGEGIDSIMGLNSSAGVDDDCDVEKHGRNNSYNSNNNITCYGYPIGGFGLNYDFGFGIRSGVIRTLRKVEEERNWWRFPTVEVTSVTNPKAAKRVSKNKKVERPAAAAAAVAVVEELKRSKSETGHGGSGSRLLLKLNYDSVLNAWSDKGSPLPEEISGSESPGGNDIHAKLAEIDLFSENGGLREASVMRYKEKRRSRLFSKKIRYQVRKVNADRRPRMKGRFVRSPNSPMSGEG